MQELGFEDQVSSSSMSGFRVRDDSPDSVIFTSDSNFSIFSSASASDDRCSFASEVHNPEFVASEVPLHLFGLGGENLRSSSGPDRDQIPHKFSLVDKHSRFCGKGKKAKAVQKQDSNAGIEDENQQLDSARNSFSLALKECQDRRSRSDVLSSNLVDSQRPASLDLNNVAASSPRFSTMKKSAVSPRKSVTFPSPSTPDYRPNTQVMQKGWSSDRVPLHNNCVRKHVNPGLLPINNGKLLPSKWEDAERWIFSPVSGDVNVRSSTTQAQRLPKSKSGPLGPPGLVHYSLYSPAMPMFEGVGHFAASSPFSSGVISADRLSIRSCGQGAAIPVRTEPCIARSVSVHGCSKMSGRSPLTDSQGENFEEINDAGANVSRTVSRRDMATQMSPASSIQSSPKKRFSFSASNPLGLPKPELKSILSSKLEVRDVQVDERVTMTRWSKKHKAQISGRGYVEDWKKKDKDAVVQTFAWDISDTAKSASNSKREARITAWENLQTAKAEAAIRKLEMKLEKKRSSSMDKIMNKVRSAQKRAQDMRSSVLANQGHQVTRRSSKAISFCRNRQMSSLSGCFTCHAF